MGLGRDFWVGLVGRGLISQNGVGFLDLFFLSFLYLLEKSPRLRGEKKTRLVHGLSLVFVGYLKATTL